MCTRYLNAVNLLSDTYWFLRGLLQEILFIEGYVSDWCCGRADDIRSTTTVS